MPDYFSKYSPCILDHAENSKRETLLNPSRFLFLTPEKLTHPLLDWLHKKKERRNPIYVSICYGKGIFTLDNFHISFDLLRWVVLFSFYKGGKQDSEQLHNLSRWLTLLRVGIWIWASQIPKHMFLPSSPCIFEPLTLGAKMTETKGYRAQVLYYNVPFLL